MKKLIRLTAACLAMVMVFMALPVGLSAQNAGIRADDILIQLSSIDFGSTASNLRVEGSGTHGIQIGAFWEHIRVRNSFISDGRTLTLEVEGIWAIGADPLGIPMYLRIPDIWTRTVRIPVLG
ncbi:MAG: hypothetical protein FWE33_07270 [Defluviitaleaceae bacterium]|nr:hypothetical protein [Defluviitaleaceae bacterium]